MKKKNQNPSITVHPNNFVKTLSGYFSTTGSVSASTLNTKPIAEECIAQMGQCKLFSYDGDKFECAVNDCPIHIEFNVLVNPDCFLLCKHITKENVLPMLFGNVCLECFFEEMENIKYLYDKRKVFTNLNKV